MAGVTREALAVVLQLLAPISGPEHPLLPPFGYSAEQVFCLAQNAFWEARNQSEEGRLAVAFVTMNRVKSHSFPDTICEVVWQRKQFSWTHDGKSDRIPPVRVQDGTWERTVRVVLRALSPYTDDPTNGALFYHAGYVEPPWTQDIGMSAVLTIGDHTFYRRERR